MLVPGTWSWLDTVPIVIVALLVLYLPGLGVGLAARARPGVAFGLAPALTIGVIAAGGVVCGALHQPWGWGALIITTVVAVGVAALIGRCLAPPPDSQRAAAPEVRGGLHSRPMQTLATGSGVACAFGFLAWLLVRSSRTPEAFPQQPDTIFHLGVAQWMTEHADISFFHANAFATGVESGGYPVGFHDLTATISLLTGAPVVVATSAFVLVVGGFAWPLSLAVLAREVISHRPEVGASAAVMGVMFTAYPFLPMALGVLWPNFLGQALMPSVLTATAIAVRQPRGAAAPKARVHAAVVAAMAVPGLAMAHVNALVSVLVLVWCMVLVAAARLAAQPGRPTTRWLPLVVTLALPVLGFPVSRRIAPEGMLASTTPGPETGVRGGALDTIFFAPHGTAHLVVVSVLVAIGAVCALWRYRASVWAIVGSLIFMGLYFANATIDAAWTRDFTWPWYNVSHRLAAVIVVPAAVLATVAVVAMARLLVKTVMRHSPDRTIAAARCAVAVALVVGVVVLTGGYRQTKFEPLQRWFYPSEANSWASPEELRALRALAPRIPSDSRVAANPWNGATYLYVVSGRQLLWPTEKTNLDPQHQLLGLRLDEIGSDPEVCRAAQRYQVTHAITGGIPFSWAGKRADEYAGVDAVGESSAWTKVATEGPYTLYRRTACAP